MYIVPAISVCLITSWRHVAEGSAGGVFGATIDVMIPDPAPLPWRAPSDSWEPLAVLVVDAAESLGLPLYSFHDPGGVQPSGGYCLWDGMNPGAPQESEGLRDAILFEMALRVEGQRMVGRALGEL